MDVLSDYPTRFSLRGLFVLTSLVAFAVALVSFTSHRAFGIHLLFILIGWILKRYVGGRLGGVVPALIGFDFLACISIPWIQKGNEDFFREMFLAISTCLVAIGIGVLCILAEPRNKGLNNQAWLAGGFTLALILWWVTVPRLGEASTAKRRAADVSANIAAASRAIELVEEVGARWGLSPDKQALNQRLSEPLPRIQWDGSYGEISYFRTSGTTYQLQYVEPCGFWGDILTYDSTKPEKGWVRVPF